VLAQRPTDGRALLDGSATALLPAERAPALAQLLGLDAAPAGEGRGPGLGGPQALIVDLQAGAGVGEGGAEAARAVLQRGGRVLLFAAPGALTGEDTLSELAGLSAAAALPRTEVLARTVTGSPRTRRLDTEVAVVDAVRPLRPARDDVVPLLTATIGFRECILVAERAVGAGRVTVCGVAPSACTPLVPLLRRALAPEAAPEERALRVGIVGYGPYGGMGLLHGLAVQATDGLELVTACDQVAERRAAAAVEFAGLRTVATVDEVARDPAVDVAVVALPPALHGEVALRLLRAGKHVVCEKPLCLTTADADRLIGAAESGGLTLTVHQNRRWDADYLALRRAVDAGLCGELFNIETFVGGFEHPCRAWHTETTMSGGAVFDWGSHHVDWILQLLGDRPASVTMHTHKRVWHDVSNSDQLRLRLTYADGREAQFLHSDICAVRPPKFLVQGTAGTIAGWYRPLVAERVEPALGHVRQTFHHAEAPVELSLRRYESGYGLVETVLPPLPPPRFAFHRNLADHLHLGEPLAVTTASVRALIAVLEAGTLSAQRGGAAVALEVGGDGASA